MRKRFLVNLRCPYLTRGLFAVHGAASIAACFRFSVFVLLLLACDQSLCRGGQILQTPVGLKPGDQFRFVFVTDGTTNATSTAISSYDAFVTAQAGGATYNGMTVTWQAIGSTATVNAVAHVGSSTGGVFLASGTEVATSTTASLGGLWYQAPNDPNGILSGSLLHPIDQDLTGQTFTEAVWTGTAKSSPFGHTSVDPLGGTPGNPFAKPGDSGASDSDWIASTIFGDSYTNDYAMYGISQVLTVQAAAVPEPSSFALLALGGIGLALGAYRRRRSRVAPAAIKGFHPGGLSDGGSTWHASVGR
jgi:hypothetical protein